MEVAEFEARAIAHRRKSAAIAETALDIAHEIRRHRSRNKDATVAMAEANGSFKEYYEEQAEKEREATEIWEDIARAFVGWYLEET